MSIYTYPTAAELSLIEREKLPVLTANQAIFSILPIVNKDAPLVMWEQKDNVTGLQSLRGLDGAPTRVNKLGQNRYSMNPGIYGEFIEFTEEELTLLRGAGTFAQPISLDSMVMDAQEQLLDRRLQRIATIGWNVLTGTFSVAGPGGLVHTDRYNVQRLNAAVPWATRATATPLQDFRNAQLLQRGRSVDFGNAATAYMNRVTFNNMVANLNANDLAGRRVSGLTTVLSLGEINRVLLDENLPTVQIEDGGYLNDSGTFVPHIADGVVIIVGRRAAGVLGEYQMTRNATNPNMEPGAYTRVVDTAANGSNPVPRKVQVHDGHNGGPALFYPGAIIVLNAA